MNQFEGQRRGSLQEHLANSIRRAKQKIYSNAINNQSQYAEVKTQTDELKHYSQFIDSRGRTQSFKVTSLNGSGKEDKNTLAAAMKTLQQRILILQRQKKEMQCRDNGVMQKKYGRQIEKNQNQERQLTKLVSALRDKQHEIKKLNRVMSDMSMKNADLLEKVLELQEQLQRYQSSHDLSERFAVSKNQPEQQQLKQRGQVNQAILMEKDLRIKELQESIKELNQRNTISHKTIEDLMKQLQNEKKTNLKWIKLLESQMIEVEQKQNSSLEANKEIKQQVRAKSRHNNSDLKRQNTILIKNNKQMYESLQRTKIKMSEMSRDCKQYEQRYNKMKLITTQIVQNVNKIIPTPNSHIKYLMTKIMKMESYHLESLRSFSNNPRKSRLVERSSNSKDRKRSLKMEDLNSSQKKSRERSGSKSNQKRKIEDSSVTKSQKKKIKLSEQERQIDQLEKQVNVLKKKYRNLIAKSEKDKSSDPEINRQIEQTSHQYNSKKDRLDDLKRIVYEGVRESRKDSNLRA